MNDFFTLVSDNPVIASITDLNQLDVALNSSCQIIFLLTGNIFNLKTVSNKIFNKNKELYVYVDAIDGFSKDSWGLEYIIKNIPLNGIITSKPSLVQQSKNMGIFTIQRMCLYDTLSLEKLFYSIKECRPNGLEILPGVIPTIIKHIVKNTRIPLIAGGLIFEREDIITCLEAGSIAISTSNSNIWYDDFKY